jgi:hypothetical protein
MVSLLGLRRFVKKPGPVSKDDLFLRFPNQKEIESQVQTFFTQWQKSKRMAKESPADIQKQLDRAKSLLYFLELKTCIGSDPRENSVMMEGGLELQEIAHHIQKQISPHEVEYLLSQYDELRGLGYEAEGLYQCGDRLKAVKRSWKFLSLAQTLIDFDHFQFSSHELVFAHTVKVQALIALGRFYDRLPASFVKVLGAKDPIYFFRQSIFESLTNPGKLKQAVNPIVPRLFWIKHLLGKSSKQSNQREIKRLLGEIEHLFMENISPFEIHLKPLIEGLSLQFAESVARLGIDV